MKFCPECGTKNEGFNFCPSCGYKFGKLQIDNEEVFQSETQIQNKRIYAFYEKKSFDVFFDPIKNHPNLYLKENIPDDKLHIFRSACTKHKHGLYEMDCRDLSFAIPYVYCEIIDKAKGENGFIIYVCGDDNLNEVGQVSIAINHDKTFHYNRVPLDPDKISLKGSVLKIDYLEFDLFDDNEPVPKTATFNLDDNTKVAMSVFLDFNSALWDKWMNEIEDQEDDEDEELRDNDDQNDISDLYDNDPLGIRN